MDQDDLYQVAALVDQMKHDDVGQRVNAFRSVERIAHALGPERTREELIPFITESMEDEDAVISVLAEKLGPLCNYVGGDEYVFVLLRPLELLVCGEESSIRDKALASAQEIVKRMSAQHINGYFLNLLQSLSNKDWFTARAATASLAPLIFGKLEESKKNDVLSTLVKLSEDEAPAVRRSVARALSLVVRKTNLAAHKQLIELLQRLSKDDQDSIRITVIPAIIAFVELISWDMKVNFVVPLLVDLSRDKSWRVRWSLAHKIQLVFPFFRDGSSSSASSSSSSAHTQTLISLAQVYDALLNDPEPEVRAAAAHHLSSVSGYLPQTTISATILPTVQRLAADNSEYVKAVVSGQVSLLSPVLGKDETIRVLLPLMLTLLRDEASEVRLNVISQLHGVHSTIGVELLSQSLLPAIAALGRDTKWRVRLAVMELMPTIGRQLGERIFTEHLVSLCVAWLHDNVHAIRKAAAVNLQHLTKLFGEEWTSTQIVPQIVSMSAHTHHLQRMTSLYAARVLMENFPENTELARSLAKTMCVLKQDTVANVRLTLAKVLSVPLQCLSSQDNVRAEVRATLQTMLMDSDRDVRYYANETLKKST